MSIFYLSADQASGTGRLPPVIFAAAAFHEFEQSISRGLDQLVLENGGTLDSRRTPAATAWRFRRHRENGAD